MRYTGEVRFRFSGDEELARQYIPAARTVLGQLLTRSQELGGLEQDRVARRLAGGVFAVCEFYPGQPPIIEIFATPPEIEEVDEDIGQLIVAFYQGATPFAFPNYADVYPTRFNELFTAYRDAPAPFYQALNPTTYQRYFVGDEMYSLTVTEPGGGIRRHTVPLPGGTDVVFDEDVSGGTGVSFNGSRVSAVAANRQHVFITYLTMVPVGAFNATATAYFVVYEYDGTLVDTVQLGPSFQGWLSPTELYDLTDSISAWSNGIYVMMNPRTSAPGAVTVFKWSADDGTIWTTNLADLYYPPSNPKDPDELVRTLAAGPSGVILRSVARPTASNGFVRLNMLDPATGDSTEATVIATSNYPLTGSFTFISSSVLGGKDYVFVPLQTEQETPLQPTLLPVIDVYTDTLQFVKRVDAEQLAAVFGRDYQRAGFTQLYNDAELVDQP